MFYERFVQLCEQRGVKPSRAAVEANIAKSAVANWKQNGQNPNSRNVEKLCAYFGISRDELFGDSVGSTGDGGADQGLRPLERELLSIVRGMNDDDLRLIIPLVRRMADNMPEYRGESGNNSPVGAAG